MFPIHSFGTCIPYLVTYVIPRAYRLLKEKRARNWAPGKTQIQAKNNKNLRMHIAVQTAVATIISYKTLSGLNFARCIGQYGSYMPSSPLGSISPWLYKYTENHSEIEL